MTMYADFELYELERVFVFSRIVHTAQVFGIKKLVFKETERT